MSEKKEVPIVPAATVLICRDSVDGLEVFMVVRHHKIDFASGALVFPGGKVEAEDQSLEFVDHVTGAEGLSDEERAFEIGAIRESFEECGVLLAREKDSGEYVSAERLSSFDHYRDELNNGHKGLLNMVKKENLALATEDMHPYAHWVTPDMMPKRFDTRFYITRAPEDHVAMHDGSESVDSLWATPQRVMGEADEGKWTVIFPTRCNLEMLAEASSVEDALERAKNRTIVTVRPTVDKTGDQPMLRIPVEAGYPVSETPVSTIQR
ncbi:MAG: NUDIX domain-containing protein [Candidatus Hydrogenedentes bacterium]|jgi:8-oxo-dGTP pyrophosphatase MutT (NUDIX family)|nr:NUDIX domain-containing protein [Candidatus Hydrogenedentota bacterium]